MQHIGDETIEVTHSDIGLQKSWIVHATDTIDGFKALLLNEPV